MSIKAAIFDMDGTLLDSMYLWIDIGPRYLESKGIEYTEDIKRETKLMLLPELGQYFIDHGLIDISVDEFIEEVNASVEHGYYHEVPVKPGVVECLEMLSSHGVRMVVATATDRHLVEAALTRVGIMKYFEKIFTCTEVGADKKVPVIFDAALAYLGTDKSETYVFEDTLTPIKTVNAAGYPLIAICDKWSSKHKDEIIPLADIYTENLAELDFEQL
ncbi:MAG: HAD family phosphatase [Clostridia bacterium]|nr:HAD family phosphatase [Clostridia bacterium]